MNLAVIPARGGSKRIPKKNIREFCGKPIIAYSIEAALHSQLFDHVVVSTDDSEIAAVARSYGAEIPFQRPLEISDDHTVTNAVVKHAIEWYRANNLEFAFVCCIYATAPLLQVAYLKAAYDRLIVSDKSFAFAVTSYPFPIQRAIRINLRGEVEAIWPQFINSRSQDLEDAYHDAGQFYWGRPEVFIKDAVLFSPFSIPVIMPRHLVQDIDTLEDWRRAELLYQLMHADGAVT